MTTEDLFKCTFFASFERYGTTFKKDFIIFFYNPHFKPYIIKEIYMLNNTIFLLCQELFVVSFERHYLSYIIQTPPATELVTFPIDSIRSPPLHIIFLNGNKFLRPKPLYQDLCHTK